MPVDRSHDERNAQERGRLAALAGRSEAELGRDLGGGWTVGAALGHLAFWDRFAHERLKVLAGGGTAASVSDAVVDALNEALVHQWRALSPKAAAAEALAAAEAIDREIAGLSDEAIEQYRATLAPGQAPRLLDRTGHRQEHAEQIERALG